MRYDVTDKFGRGQGEKKLKSRDHVECRSHIGMQYAFFFFGKIL